MKQWWVLSIIALNTLVLFASDVYANCECGYSITTGDDSSTHVFTDLLESDFLHIDYLGSVSNQGRGWTTQSFNKSAVRARGPFGESFVPSNSKGNLIKDDHIWTGDGTQGGDAGLELVVAGKVVDEMLAAGQVATMTGDYFYGSYRTSMKITAVKGTCTAVFWVRELNFNLRRERGGS